MEKKEKDLKKLKSDFKKNRLTGLCRKACYVLPTIFLIAFVLGANLTVYADEKTDVTGGEDTGYESETDLENNGENESMVEMVNYGVTDVDMEAAPRIVPDEEDVLMAIPSSYDSRRYGNVTSVKNQNPYGTCWSFATISALESSLLSHDIMGNPDLSELHLIRYSFNNIGDDPLGGTKGDKITFLGTDMRYQGGNGLTNFHALANWRGATPESYAPYSGNVGEVSMDDAYNHDTVHLQQFYRISWQDVNYVKQAIMSYGAIGQSFYYDKSYLNKKTSAYFTDKPAGTSTNHSICIVGWNDNYSRKNFAINPGRDGAWLVKNSWGTSFGQNGYCWISYAEPTFYRDCGVYVGELANNYDNNYQYDGCYTSASITPSGSNRAVSNVFTVKGNKRQQLKAVSIELISAQADYSIQI